MTDYPVIQWVQDSVDILATFHQLNYVCTKIRGKVFPDTSQVALPGWQPIHS